MGQVLAWNLILKYYFYRKFFIFDKNYTKSEQISRVHTKLQSSITPRKKTEIKKIFLILNSTLDQLFNDTTHISLRRIYRSAKIDWTKIAENELLFIRRHVCAILIFKMGKMYMNHVILCLVYFCSRTKHIFLQGNRTSELLFSTTSGHSHPSSKSNIRFWWI